MTTKPFFYGFNPPFFGGPQNILSRQEDDRLIKNDILQLLLTVPGERVMLPEFGVQLRSAVFEPITKIDISALQNEIFHKLLTYEPRVTVKHVAIEPDTDNNGLRIAIVAVMKKDPKKELNIEQFIAGRA